MEKQLHYEIHDHVVTSDLHRKVWYYIQGLEHYAMLKNSFDPKDRTVIHYVPKENKQEYYNKDLPAWNNQFMHRVGFGLNEQEVQDKHPVIFELWNQINSHFGNKFVISGDEEDCYDRNNPYLMQRAYVNVQPKEEIKRSHGVHRDTVDLEQTDHFSLLYIPNPIWYPTWFGELMFYENDDSFGDFQQFQKNRGQSRGFGVGHPFATIPTVPNRIVLWDGRMLHTTRPTAQGATQLRNSLIFRVSLKKEQHV
jgi:hypothetical protein